MVRIDGKAFRLFLPALTEVFVWGEAFESFESLGKVVSHEESLEMLLSVLRGLILVFLYRSFLERAVHAFDLAIGPRVVGCGQSMIDTILLTDTSQEMLTGSDIALAIGEREAVSRSDRRDLLRPDGHQVP